MVNERYWLSEYIDLIGCVNPKDLRIDAAIKLKNKFIPAKLYKYRPPNDYAIENLEMDTAWLNKPADYNDLFEFTEFIDLDQFQNDMEKKGLFNPVTFFSDKIPIPDDVKEQAKQADNSLEFLTEYVLAKEGHDKATIEQFIKFTQEMMKTRHWEIQQKKVEYFQEHMRVCSFCESKDQLLMWGHYASNHAGFCIEYNTDLWAQDDIRRRVLFPVVYTKQRFDATEHMRQSLEDNHYNNLYPIVSGSTKAEEWSYEKEWRFIFNIGPTFPKQNYRMDCQSAVYLGYRMPEKIKDRIIGICTEKKIPVFQSRPSKTLYQLEFDMI